MSNTRTIKEIIIHCSASDDSLDIGAREIKHLHTAPPTEKVMWDGQYINGRGWSDIGYHYVVRRDGSLEKGRPDWQRGAHVKGRNRNSIGVCWIGKKEITKDQYQVLLCVVRALMNQYDVGVEQVLGHNEIDHLKTCPNLYMIRFRADLLFLKGEDIGAAVKEIVKL